MIRGGIPQRLQGRIRLECLGQVLRARGTDGVFIEAASERRKGLSMAADGCQIGQVWTGALDGLQRGIHFEHLADRDDALGSVVAIAVFVDSTEGVIG